MNTRIFITLFIGCVLCSGLAPQGAWAESPPPLEGLQVVFEDANAMYEAGDYEAAISGYQALIDKGVVDKDLYYNLANAFFRQGDLGRAILNYERALKLSPREEDAAGNLAFVRSLIKDKQFVKNEIWFVRGLMWGHNHMSLNEGVVLTSLLYLILCLLLIVTIFIDGRFMSSLYRRLSLISPGRFLGLSSRQDLFLAIVIVVTLLAASGISSFDKYRDERQRRAAVVLAEEVLVYSAPTEDATLQFKIHEGTRVRVAERRSGWTKVLLPGGLSGWIATNSIEAI
jgi:tetratricopeptide (TPR) repeat protein